ncbi:hypothetical protein B4N89_04045 [Embleya scabrispora]|uniref:Uncharacterized protein n=1 Tax=Embleya scabrispora TaxID=159449 RepID=A0A1T3NTK3_9ACTN|nr:hypothetical protein B4N89_04045 [Embleya scabrispora]
MSTATPRRSRRQAANGAANARPVAATWCPNPRNSPRGPARRDNTRSNTATRITSSSRASQPTPRLPLQKSAPKGLAAVVLLIVPSH